MRVAGIPAMAAFRSVPRGVRFVADARYGVVAALLFERFNSMNLDFPSMITSLVSFRPARYTLHNLVETLAGQYNSALSLWLGI